MVYKIEIDYEKKIVDFGTLVEQMKANQIKEGRLIISFDIIKEIAEQIAIRDFTPRDKLKEDGLEE